MTWVFVLGWVLFALTIADRAFHSWRLWWAPIFGIAIQVPWAIYGIGLGVDGWPVVGMAALITGVYTKNVGRWVATRARQETQP